MKKQFEKYLGDDPTLRSGVILFRGHSSRAVQVPSMIRGQSPQFVDLAAPPSARFTSSGTVPLTMSFTDQSISIEDTIVDWSWTFGHGTGSTDQHVTHFYDVTGSFFVTLSASDGSGRVGSTGSVVVVS